MNVSTQVAGISGITQPEVRSISQSTLKLFGLWTLFWWGGVGLFALLFYVGVLDFVTSTKIPLYGISIWLNGCLLPLLMNKGQSRMNIYHDCLVVWMLSYTLTNLLWEIPWVIFSPFVFENIHTIDDVIAHTEYMRESIFHMYWWTLASFSSVDLRTVNHDPTFYTLEIYAFVNVLSTLYFFHLNKKGSPYRYLIPIIGCGEPIAATFIFSFTEVFAGFENMVGGVADTLLALVWTQYQYILFPIVFGIISTKLLLNDWQQSDISLRKSSPVYG
ncbi:hypothetical protein A9Q99_25960 [Gammaproteobacteria bacterium 45_16_T64]|nr:hypothetical protein A9Q99_25960 [Gammaproteobacteria bacterium 45_16_T64]